MTTSLMTLAWTSTESFFSASAAWWLTVLLDVSLKAVVILAAAGAATLAMRKSSATARHLVWMLALVAILALPLASAALPSWQILPGWAKIEVRQVESATPDTADLPAGEQAESPPVASADPQNDTISMTNVPAAGGAGHLSPISAETHDLEAAPPQPPVQVASASAPPTPNAEAGGAAGAAEKSPRAWIIPAIAATWLVGALACLAPLVLGHLSLNHLKRTATLTKTGPLAELLAEAAGQLGLKRRVNLLVSSRRSMPMIWGILRPKLLLPAEAHQWTTERRRVVLLHELAHASRWDCLAKCVAHIACAMYWFNPMAWIAFKRMQIEAEIACDDLVLAAGARPSQYAKHILEIASGLHAPLMATHSSIAMARPSKLEGRLLAILDGKRNRRRLTLVGVIIAALLVTGLVLPISIMRAQSADDKPAADALAARGERNSRTTYLSHVLNSPSRSEMWKSDRLLEHHVDLSPNGGSFDWKGKTGFGNGGGQIIISNLPAEDKTLPALRMRILQRMVEAVKELDALSAVTDSNFSDTDAFLKGPEGWIRWKILVDKTRFTQAGDQGDHWIPYEWEVQFTPVAPVGPKQDPKRLGHYPKPADHIAALKSPDADARIAAAMTIYPDSGPKVEALLQAIESETEARVLTLLVEPLIRYTGINDHTNGKRIFQRLLPVLNSNHAELGRAAARAVAGNGTLWMAMGRGKDLTKTARKRLRNAAVDMLKYTGYKAGGRRGNAAQVLAALGIAGDHDAMDAVLDAMALELGSARVWAMTQPLRTPEDPYPVDRLFEFVKEADRPELWYRAADVLEQTWPMEYSRRLTKQTGRTKLRMLMVGDNSQEIKDKLAAMGPDVRVALSRWVQFPVRLRCPGLAYRACSMLGYVGDARDAPALADALRDTLRNGLGTPDLNLSSSAVLIIRTVNRLTARNYGNLGSEPTGDTTDAELKALDWKTLVAAIDKDFPPAADGATTQPAAQETFGPVRSHVITPTDANGRALVFIDMESGKLFQPPYQLAVDDGNAHFIKLTEALKEWITANEVDAVIRIRKKNWSMMGLQMRNGSSSDPAEFETITADKIRRSYEKKYPPERVSGYVPFAFGRSGYEAGCFWFRTQEGTLGLFSYDKAPQGKPGLAIRYKLVVPATQPEARPAILSRDLSGRWEGQREGVKAQIEFDGKAGAAIWRIHVPKAMIVAELKLVDEQPAGTVGLRVDYYTTATGKKGSAVIGRLARDASGALTLSVLPAAERLESDYKTVSGIRLHRVGPAKWGFPTTQPALQALQALKKRVAKLSLEELVREMVVKRARGSSEHLTVIRPSFNRKLAGIKPDVRAKIIRLLVDEIAVLQEGKQYETRGTLHDRRYLFWYLGDLGARDELRAMLKQQKTCDCCAIPAMIDSFAACAPKEDAWLLVSKFTDLQGDNSLGALHTGLRKLTGLALKAPSSLTPDAWRKLWTEQLTRAGIKPAAATQPAKDAKASVRLISADADERRYRWHIHKEKPLCIRYGVTTPNRPDGKPLLAARSITPSDGAQEFKLQHWQNDGKLHVSVGDSSGRGWDSVSWPSGTTLRPTQLCQTGHLIDGKYKVLWAADVMKDEQRIDRVYFCAEVSPQARRQAGPFDPRGEARRQSLVRQDQAALRSLLESHKRDIPWGKETDGLQIRVRSERAAWTSPQRPVISLDIRNEGRTKFNGSSVSVETDDCRIEFDGRTYKPVLLNKHVLWRPGPEEAAYDVLDLDLTGPRPWDNWVDEKTDKRLQLTPGKHTVRVMLRLRVKLSHLAPKPLLVSNQLEIDIPSAPDAAIQETAPPITERLVRQADG